MQLLQYAEIQSDDQQDARDRERIALERSLALMECASRSDSPLLARTQAIVFTSKLWTVLIEDLASTDNRLPRDLRAQIISIGIWLLRELESLRNEPDRSFDDVIAVSTAIRDGLL